jgi:hypothetical protein
MINSKLFYKINSSKSSNYPTSTVILQNHRKSDEWLPTVDSAYYFNRDQFPKYNKLIAYFDKNK